MRISAAFAVIILLSASIFCGPINETLFYPEKTDAVYFIYAENYFERSFRYDVEGSIFTDLLKYTPALPSSGMKQTIAIAWRFANDLSLFLSSDYVSQKISGNDPYTGKTIDHNYNEFQGCEFSVSYPFYGIVTSLGAGIPVYSKDYTDNRLYNSQPGASIICGLSYSVRQWFLQAEAYAKAELFLTGLKREFMAPVQHEYSGGGYLGAVFFEDEFQRAGAGIGADLLSEDSPDLGSLRVLFVPQARVSFNSGLSVMAGAEIMTYADSMYERTYDKIFYTAKVTYTPVFVKKAEPDAEGDTMNGDTVGK